MSEQIIRIPLDQLHDSPNNPRRRYIEQSLQELAADIKANDVLQPLLVRPRVPALFAGTDDPNAIAGYEVVFGHRRKRGAELAGLLDVPCMVRVISDEEAKRAQISENLAREDVHPIEEAEGFSALMKDHGVSADQLAEQTGKSRSYIYGRLTLLKACKEIRDACLAGEIGSEVALLIARLRTDKLQQRALGYIKGKYISLGDGGASSFRQVRDLLRERFTLTLGKGGCMFAPENAALLPDAGACTACPKRSGNAPEYADLLADSKGLHGHVYARGSEDLCTDPDCYEAKKRAHLDACAAELKARGAHVVQHAAARAAISADGEVKGAYLPLDQVKAELAEARRAAQAQRVEAPKVFSIQDPRTGKVVHAVKAAELKGVGIKVATPEPKRDNWAEQEKRQREQRARDEAKARDLTARNLAVLERVRAAVASTDRSAFDLALVAKTALAGVDYHDRETLAGLWGLPSYPALQQRVGQMGVAELTTLLIDCALIAGVKVRLHELRAKPDTLWAAAAHYGVDPKAVQADQAKQLVQTPAKAAATPSTAARAPGGGAGAGAKKAVRYRCPDTGMTWSGRGLQPAWLKAALARGVALSALEAGAQPAAGAGSGDLMDQARAQTPACGGEVKEQMDNAGGAAAGEAADQAREVATHG